MLAPMAGVTDLAFRRICFELGCTFAVTEMVSAKGFLLSSGNPKQMALLATDPLENGRIAVQLFGNEPDVIREAADRITSRGSFAVLDINMGCPVPKVVKQGSGSALLNEIPTAVSVLRAAVEGSHVPVSVKLRTGYKTGSDAYLAVGKAAEEAGVSFLVLHARSREQMYSGRADWEKIRLLAQSVSIPVIGNGDIRSAEDAARMLDETGCAGVAVGRGAQGNPWIFSEIRDRLAGRSEKSVSREEKLAVILRHLAYLVSLKGERTAIREMRTHASDYIRGMRNATEMRTRIQKMETQKEFEEEMSRFFLENAKD